MEKPPKTFQELMCNLGFVEKKVTLTDVYGNGILGGGFKYFLFSLLFGKDSQFD